MIKSIGLATASIAIAALSVTETGRAMAAGTTISRPRMELPERLSSDPQSPFYDRAILRKVGVRFNGRDRPKDVIEYNRPEGWLVVHVFDAHNKPVQNKDGTWRSMKLVGEVEPYWRNGAPEVFANAPDPLPAAHFKSAAEEKRARKAAKLKALADKGALGKVEKPESVAEKAAPKKPRVRKPTAKKVMTA